MRVLHTKSTLNSTALLWSVRQVTQKPEMLGSATLRSTRRSSMTRHFSRGRAPMTRGSRCGGGARGVSLLVRALPALLCSAADSSTAHRLAPCRSGQHTHVERIWSGKPVRSEPHDSHYGQLAEAQTACSIPGLLQPPLRSVGPDQNRW